MIQFLMNFQHCLQTFSARNFDDKLDDECEKVFIKPRKFLWKPQPKSFLTMRVTSVICHVKSRWFLVFLLLPPFHLLHVSSTRQKEERSKNSFPTLIRYQRVKFRRAWKLIFKLIKHLSSGYSQAERMWRELNKWTWYETMSLNHIDAHATLKKQVNVIIKHRFQLFFVVV